MGFGSDTLGFIRKVFSKGKSFKIQELPAISSTGYLTHSGAFGYDYLSTTSTQFGGVSDYVRVEQDLVARFIDYEDQDESPLISSALDIYCLTGDCRVPLLDGSESSIVDLYSKGKKNFWVYSFDTKTKAVVPGLCAGVKKTGINQKIYRVTFTDGSYVRCTGNHKFLSLGSKYIKATDLKVGTRIMALVQAKYKTNGRKSYYESVLIEPFKKKLAAGLRLVVKRLGYNSYESLVEQAKNIQNHVVESITEDGFEDVYDLIDVNEYHNFAVGTGINNSFVFVHNSDDSTQISQAEGGKSIWVDCEDDAIQKDLENLYHKTLDVEGHIWGSTRSFCKYGNHYWEQVVRDGEGVVALNYLPAPTVRRIELPHDNACLGFIFDPRGAFKISTGEFLKRIENRDASHPFGQENEQSKGVAVFEDWEIVHMRLQGKTLNSIYGFGVGEPARWIYKRLVLLEDSIILHRLSRAPGRFAFYVDVSNIPPNETNAYLTQVKNRLKKQRFVNPGTGKLDLKHNTLAGDEDFFLPTRDGQDKTRVEALAGPVYDHIEDVKFFENKLFAALKVPKPFLTYEETTAKTHLSAEDARFARTIMRIQREIRSGYKKIGRVHLAARNVNPDAVDFEIGMTIPSAIFELAQLEIRSAELELAEKFKAWAPTYWIMTEILGFSDSEIEEMERQRISSGEDSLVGRQGGGGGSASGAIAQAVSKRGSPKAPAAETQSPVAAGGGAGEESRVMSTDRFLLDGKKHNTTDLRGRIDELREKNKSFDHRWSRIEGYLKDLRSTMNKR